MGSTRPSCLVCDAAEGKYKCPRCNLFTCSLPCFQEHRDSHPLVEAPVEAPKPMDTTVVETSNVDYHAGRQEGETFKESEIADMPEYAALIQKYPNLESLLWNIAAATDPPTADGGGNSAFPGSNKGYRKTNQPWTKDTGYENGLEVLRRTRETPGSDRDALREYCELVRLRSARIESANVAAKIRRQFAQDDAKAIQELLEAEKSKAF